MKDIDKYVEDLVVSFIDDESLFLVNVKISGKQRKLVRVLLDGDQGVSIDQCASLSRALGTALEEEDSFDVPYDLEVTSPGVGEPLKMTRQFKANVGRKMKINLLDGEKISGVVESVTDESLEIQKEKRVKKKKTTEKTTIPLADIKEASVMVSFK